MDNGHLESPSLLPWVATAVLVVAAGIWLLPTGARPPTAYDPDAPRIVLTARIPTSEPIRDMERALYEPEQGLYLGAYIDLEPKLKDRFIDQFGTERRRPWEFERAVGREHASYFFYMGYGRPLPIDWVRYLASQGKIVQIALEPNDGLEVVSDNEYLHSLADDLRNSGARIFLRFASEMNGDWVGYHGDPEKYVEKWRLVTRVMRDRAPNVAMVWCPYALPLGNLDEYYPGDEYVDWVGVNLYNVTYFNQDRGTPARHISPRDLLRPIYERFADRKPIMICEYATTHFSAVENASVPYFAANNIQELYGSLRTEFPRVKAIYYFSSNNLKLPHRQNNDYSLLGDPRVLEAYRRATTGTHFLTRADDGKPYEPQWRTKPVHGELQIDRRIFVYAWAQAEVALGTLIVRIDGKRVHHGKQVREWSFVLDPTRLRPGRRKLTVTAYGTNGEVEAEREVWISVAPTR